MCVCVCVWVWYDGVYDLGFHALRIHQAVWKGFKKKLINMVKFLSRCVEKGIFVCAHVCA